MTIYVTWSKLNVNNKNQFKPTIGCERYYKIENKKFLNITEEKFTKQKGKMIGFKKFIILTANIIMLPCYTGFFKVNLRTEYS